MPGRPGGAGPACRSGPAGSRRAWRRRAPARTGRGTRPRSDRSGGTRRGDRGPGSGRRTRRGSIVTGAVVDVVRSWVPKTAHLGHGRGRGAVRVGPLPGRLPAIRAGVRGHVRHRRRCGREGSGAEPAERQVAGQGLEPGPDDPQVGLVRVVGEDGPDHPGLGAEGEVAGGPAQVAAGGGGGIDDVAGVCPAVAVGVGGPALHVEGMNCIGPTAWSRRRSPSSSATVGVAADRDADDGELAVAEDVQPAHAVVGLGLADGGEQLPAQAARRLLRRQGGLGLAVGVVGHGGHAVDGGLPELADDASNRVATSVRCAVAARQLLVSSGAGRRQQHERRSRPGPAGRRRRRGPWPPAPRGRGGLARHLERGQAPHGVVGRLVQRRQEGQEVAGAGRAVHVALDGVGPGLGDELGLELLALGGRLPGLLGLALAASTAVSGWSRALWSWAIWASRPASSPATWSIWAPGRLCPDAGRCRRRARDRHHEGGEPAPIIYVAMSAAATSAPRRTVWEPTGEPSVGSPHGPTPRCPRQRHLRCLHAPGLEDGAGRDRRRGGQVGRRGCDRADRPRSWATTRSGSTTTSTTCPGRPTRRSSSAGPPWPPSASARAASASARWSGATRTGSRRCWPRSPRRST